MTVEEQITSIEEELAKTQYNKATQGHIGKLKAKLARLREEKEKRAASGGGGQGGYDVKKSGNASVALVGFPSVGKSTILNKVTGTTTSEVASYAFTTLTCIPGMLHHKHADIQILDLPGLIRGAAKGKGRGREVLAVVRSCDLVLLIADALNPEQIFVIVDELYDANIRLNRAPADIKVYKSRMRGGITVNFTTKQTKGLDEDLVKEMVKEYGIVNADVVIRQDATIDELVDVLTGNRVYIQGLVALNKVDTQDPDYVKKAIRMFNDRGWTVVPIAASKGFNMEKLKDAVYDELRFIRVFMKPQGADADMEEPLVVKGGSSIGMVCDVLHRDMRKKFRYAIVSGPSAKFANQIVGVDHLLKDKDVLTLIVRRS
ncbi:MAG TPA: GTP-binding protein [Candidatus Thermoplasmatota archaeon]|nr:GTP-binding protein [Candidatus Thermoplasmatota archaeon]